MHEIAKKMVEAPKLCTHRSQGNKPGLNGQFSLSYLSLSYVGSLQTPTVLHPNSEYCEIVYFRRLKSLTAPLKIVCITKDTRFQKESVPCLYS